MRLTRILMLQAGLCIVSAGVLSANTGKITGKVTDAATKEPLPGANIVLEGTTIGASTDPDGHYVILNVPPGVYTATASFIGYKRIRITDTRVSVGFTTTLDFALEEGDIELEPIVVQGERTPLIRKDLTNPVASISAESIEQLPATDISKVIGLQSGVTVGDDGSIHIRGGYSNEIVYTLNGVNINNPYGNSRSVGLAINAVQEVSVSSGTFSAEYGTALSGVVNYVTKEGGRKLSGGFRVLSGDHVSNRNELFLDIDKVNPLGVNRAEATLGGPIMGDFLSFYSSGTYNYNGGHLFGRRIYAPEDSYVSREGFPSDDPRRGASSSPYYFDPYRKPRADSLGGPTGDGTIVPLNWSRSYNLQGNLSFRFSPRHKLKLEAVYDNDVRPENAGNSSSFANRYKPEGRRTARGEGFFYSFDWSHVLSDRAFYTLKGSFIQDKATSRVYDDPSDERYLPSYYLRGLGDTGFLTGGVDLFRFARETQTYGLKFDIVAQLFDIHEMKAGLEFRSHRLEVESYTLQFRDPAFPNVTPSPTNHFTGLYTFRPYIPDPQGGYVGYVRRPWELSAYVQDKIELFESIILNLGLRYDRFFPAARYNPMISEELILQESLFLEQNLQDTDAKNMVSPRVSVSYPITDRGTIRLSYGHFYQIGSLSSLFSNPFFYAPPGTNPSFGNPNVSPQRSVQYEMGLQQGLTDNMKLEITAYSKDVRDYIFSQTIITGRGDRQYSLLTNLAYANTRGVSISLVKRSSPGDPLSATVDYTFQVAEGNRTQPSDELFYNEQRGRLSETFLVPLSFDRSHTLTSTVTLSDPGSWVASMIGTIRTGTPYTPSFPSSVVPITFVQNSDYQPLQWNVDLRVEKFFKVLGYEYSFYLMVDNLFDVENELFVYANSGRSLHNIEETVNPARFTDLRNRIRRGDVGMLPAESLDRYYANPANVSTPRLVRLGMSFSF
ncbi:MAG: TonB-dependent receptor [Ignavibacteriales bacterium]|nr:TonB-dependent receptor [Ignavibacteriales bacterium]